MTKDYGNKRILTLRDVIEFVADGYKIETLRFPHNELSKEKEDIILCGMHIDNGFKKEILISRDMCIIERRGTILHEFYHALYTREGWHQTENLIDKLAKQHFKKLYEK